MKTVLITAGGTIEPIDGVRGITNFSSGKLGATIAETLTDSKVFLIKGKKSVFPTTNLENITIIEITDTQSVIEAIDNVMNNNHVDYFIHSMAISDYTVDKVVDVEDIILDVLTDSADDEAIANRIRFPKGITNRDKVSSTIKQPVIYLKQTPKVIATIKQKWPHVKLVAFKLLNNVTEEHLIEVAENYFHKTDADYVIANDLQNINKLTHRTLLLQRAHEPVVSETKIEVAEKIRDIIESDQ